MFLSWLCSISPYAAASLCTLLISAASGAGFGFPPPITHYQDAGSAGLLETLRGRVALEPFNLVASVIFLLAILHTFLAIRFTHLTHRWRDEHNARLRASDASAWEASGYFLASRRKFASMRYMVNAEEQPRSGATAPIPCPPGSRWCTLHP